MACTSPRVGLLEGIRVPPVFTPTLGEGPVASSVEEYAVDIVLDRAGDANTRPAGERLGASDSTQNVRTARVAANKAIHNVSAICGVSACVSAKIASSAPEANIL